MADKNNSTSVFAGEFYQARERDNSDDLLLPRDGFQGVSAIPRRNACGLPGKPKVRTCGGTFAQHFLHRSAYMFAVRIRLAFLLYKTVQKEIRRDPAQIPQTRRTVNFRLQRRYFFTLP